LSSPGGEKSRRNRSERKKRERAWLGINGKSSKNGTPSVTREKLT